MLNRGLDEVNNMLMACDSAVNRGGDVIHLGVCGETTDVFTDCLSQGSHRGKGKREVKKKQTKFVICCVRVHADIRFMR